MTSFSAPGSVNSRSRLKTSKLFALPSPARLGLDKKHFRPVFPSTGSGSSTHHTSHLRRIPRQRGGGGGCWLLEAGGGKRHLSSVPGDHSLSVASLGQPGPPPITVSFYLKCCAVASCAACTIQQHRAQSLSLT